MRVGGWWKIVDLENSPQVFEDKLMDLVGREKDVVPYQVIRHATLYQEWKKNQDKQEIAQFYPGQN